MLYYVNLPVGAAIGRPLLPPLSGQCHQLKEPGPDFPVIVRSAATWQSVFSLVTGAKSGRCKGNGLPRHLSALARNDIRVGGCENPGSGGAAGDFH